MPKKSTDEIVSQFTECVNMGAEELEVASPVLHADSIFNEWLNAPF